MEDDIPEEYLYAGLPPRTGEYFMSVATITIRPDDHGNVTSIRLTNGPNVQYYENTPGWFQHFKQIYLKEKGITHLLVDLPRAEMSHLTSFLQEKLPDIYVGDYELGIPRFYVPPTKRGMRQYIYVRAVQVLKWLEERISQIVMFFVRRWGPQ